MRLLLDTHVLLWWLADDRKLARAARAIIANPDNEVLVSSVSLWEIAIIFLSIGCLISSAIGLFLGFKRVLRALNIAS